jgi:hypothetical protein
MRVARQLVASTVVFQGNGGLTAEDAQHLVIRLGKRSSVFFG